MKKIVLILAALFTGFISQAQAPKVPADPGTIFGATTNADHAIPVEELVAMMKNAENKEAVPVKLKGVVTEVCQEMGCWIKIKSTNGDMTVRMKDHKFFVPEILNGKTVIIDGTATEKVTSAAQLRHLAEDGGKSKEEIAKIKDSKKEIVVQAKGILVL